MELIKREYKKSLSKAETFKKAAGKTCQKRYLSHNCISILTPLIQNNK